MDSKVDGLSPARTDLRIGKTGLVEAIMVVFKCIFNLCCKPVLNTMHSAFIIVVPNTQYNIRHFLYYILSHGGA